MVEEKTLGKHILIDFFDCDAKILDDVVHIEKMMVAAAKIARATVLNQIFHQFSPQGVSGVVVIGESHFAIHTWPEKGVAAIDFFTCNLHLNTGPAIEYLASEFKAKRTVQQDLARGICPSHL